MLIEACWSTDLRAVGVCVARAYNGQLKPVFREDKEPRFW